MPWSWGNILQPIKLSVDSQVTVGNAFALLKKSNTTICFTLEDQEINGYVTTESLLKQLVEGDCSDSIVNIEKDYLFVREGDDASYIHNCYVAIGADHHNRPSGYMLMEHFNHYMNDLQLQSFNDALNSAELGIVTMDTDFHVVFMNEKAEHILGMKMSILQGRDYRKLIRLEPSLDEVLQGQKWFGVENAFNFKVISGQFSPIFKEGKIAGISHNFYLKEQLEEAVQEIGFVREMNEDLELIYSSSNEQILVTDAEGKITKLAGAFFGHFWGDLTAGDLVGRRMSELEKQGVFKTDIVGRCIEKQSRMTMMQEGSTGKILSTASPVIEDGKLKRIMVLSKDVSVNEQPVIPNEEGMSPEIQPSDVRKVIYRSAAMHRLMKEVKAAARMESTILIQGESGVGKEVIARQVHQWSNRSSEPYIAVNCGAIPEHLMESELFGHEKGAFTGAHAKRTGLFEQANRGTVFLDEISELPFTMQVKLLRVLQEREIVRVGSSLPIKVDVRIVAASNQDLQELVDQGHFREDLFYRLHVIPVIIPPLRDRIEDVGPLAVRFLDEFNEESTRKLSLSAPALNVLESYQWPGNIRELRNAIERLSVLADEEEIREDAVYRVLWSDRVESSRFLTIRGIMPLKQAVEETEKQLIGLAVEKYGTATEAAKALEVSISTVSRRMKRFNGGNGGADHDVLL